MYAFTVIALSVHYMTVALTMERTKVPEPETPLPT